MRQSKKVTRKSRSGTKHPRRESPHFSNSVSFASPFTTAITDRHALYSTKEFKKVGVRYFTDAEVEWEKAHA